MDDDHLPNNNKKKIEPHDQDQFRDLDAAVEVDAIGSRTAGTLAADVQGVDDDGLRGHGDVLSIDNVRRLVTTTSDEHDQSSTIPAAPPLNVKPTSVQSLQTTNGIIVTDGWLLLRSRFSKKWKKRWFVLNGVNLRYGTSETKVKAKISLDGARIREADKDGKRYAFCVEPRSGHRIYYFQADDDVSRMKWMQAMCFAKVSSHRSEHEDSNDIFRRLPCTIS